MNYLYFLTKLSLNHIHYTIQLPWEGRPITVPTLQLGNLLLPCMMKVEEDKLRWFLIVNTGK